MHSIKVGQTSTNTVSTYVQEEENKFLKNAERLRNDRAPLRRRKLRLGIKYRYEDLLILHVRAIYGRHIQKKATAARPTILLSEGSQKRLRRRPPHHGRTDGRRLGQLKRGI